MQEKLTDGQPPTTSRASSFFIENILGKGGDVHESVAHSGPAGVVEAASPGTAPDSHDADTDGSGSGSAARSRDRDSPVRWHRGGTELNFRALETAQSEYRVTVTSVNR